MLRKLLAKSSARRAGELLHAAAARQSRNEALYATMGVPDTVEGRFEALTLHIVLLISRLADDGGPAGGVRQAVFDSYVSNLDGALREMGVGDLAVPKRMRKLGEAFYGRARSYDEAVQALPDETALRELLLRTALQGASAPRVEALTAYVLACRDGLSRMSAERLAAGDAGWAVQ
jgi:cytochrome b pre-mRNA-processing protein 3